MKRAADTLTPLSLELGGKDPMIVTSDADVDRAANAAAFGGLLKNTGQICLSIERVYVEEPVYDEFVDQAPEGRRGSPAPGRRWTNVLGGDRRDDITQPDRDRPRSTSRTRVARAPGS